MAAGEWAAGQLGQQLTVGFFLTAKKLANMLCDALVGALALVAAATSP
jgi:hypothetical protein